MSASTILRLTSFGFFGFGLAGLFAPQSMLGTLGVLLPVPAAVGEMRAFYGGFEIGIGVFLMIAARTERFTEAATLFCACGLGGIVFARLFSVVADGPASLIFFVSGGVELLGALANTWAYRRARRSL